MIYNKIVLSIYAIILILFALFGGYTHVFPGIFVLICLVMRNFIKKLTPVKGFVGYLILVFIFELISESLFWLGGWRLWSGTTLFDPLFTQIPFYFGWGIIYLILGRFFSFTAREGIITSGIVGIVMENFTRLPWLYTMPLNWFITVFINFVNYSFIIGFPLWLTDTEGGGGGNRILGYILLIVLPIVFAIFFISIFLQPYLDTFYPGVTYGQGGECVWPSQPC